MADNSTPNYYEILGVKENDSDDVIRKAYKKLAMKYHPDKNTHNNKTEAEKKFKEVSQAYDVLRDPQKRREYDNFRKYGGSGNFSNFSGGFGFHDMGFDFYDKMFKDFFKDFGNDDFFKDMGNCQGTSIKTSTIIQNGKKITRTEKSFIDKDGKRRTEITEDTGDGKKTTKMLDSGNDAKGSTSLADRNNFSSGFTDDPFGDDDFFNDHFKAFSSFGAFGGLGDFGFGMRGGNGRKKKTSKI